MDEQFSRYGIAFEWHVDKARVNRQKHGIDFEAACEAFFDPFIVALGDEMVDDEHRSALLGMTEQWQLLYIVYTLRGDIFRLISARPATSAERQIYENQ